MIRRSNLLNEVGDNRTLNNARTGAAEELIYRANNLKENDNYSRALELLNRVSNYDSENADAHYRLSEVHNLQGNYNGQLSMQIRHLNLNQVA